MARLISGMAPDPDERELVARAAGGDETAFREIVRRHESTVARTVTAMLGAGDDADDAGQETFIRFFRALPQFRGDAAVGTYLTRIAVNISCDILERRKKRSGWLSIGGGEDDVELPVEAAADDLERDERSARILQAVDRLDPKHKAVVVLRILEERSVKEVAELMGVPEGTVMSRLKRALEKLKTTLGPEFGS